jgi:serine protease Do
VGFRRPGETVRVEVARKGGVRKVFTVRLMEQTPEPELAARADQPEGAKKDNADEEAAINVDQLGASVQTLTPGLAAQLDLDRNLRGVVVTEVDPNGPSFGELVPLDQGGPDVIQSVEGTPIKSEADLRAALRGMKKGDIVTLKVYNARVDQSRIMRVRLQ